MAAKIGHGIVIERGDGDPSGTGEVWTKIGRVLEPDLPTLSRDAVEDTDTEATDRYRTFIGGLRNGGEISPTLVLDMADPSYAELVADYENDAPVHYRVLSPDGADAWDFMALLTNLEHETPLEDRMAVIPTFQISGKPSLVTVV